MNHIDEGTIHAWLDGALDPAEAAAVDTHVTGCAQCSATVAEARGFIAASSRILRALDAVPGNVIPVPAPVVPQKRLWRAAPWVTGIAALLVAAVTLSVRDKSQAPADSRMMASAPTVVAADSVGPVASVEAEAATAPPPRETAQTLAARGGQPVREERAVAGAAGTAGAAVGAVSGGVGADAATQIAANAAAKTVATDSARQALNRVRRLEPRLDEVVVTSERTVSAAPSAPVPPPTAALEPQRSALLDMRAIRPIDPIRDSIPSHARLTGCYVVLTGERSAAAAQDFAQSSRARGAAERRSAAPVAAMEARASNRLVIRLDSLMGRPGYVVRSAVNDSSLGWWMPVRIDSAKVDLLTAGVFGLTPAQRIECPDGR